MNSMDMVTAVGTVVTVVVAVRSTWSPCGLSMLASITPLAERGRGHRYRSTASWFVAGSVAGGATLGAVMAAGSLAVRAAGPDPGVVVAVVLVAAAAGALSDSGITGRRIPFHRRQVNERWLDGYRPWVYGAGFGWQIGSGLATYIVTAGVYLMIVLGAATGDPRVALALGTLFGLVRGLAVLLGRRVTTPAALQSLHRRLARLDPVSAGATTAVEAATAVVGGAWLATEATGGRWATGGPRPGTVLLVTTSLAAAAGGLVVLGARRRRPTGDGLGGAAPTPLAARPEARQG